MLPNSTVNPLPAIVHFKVLLPTEADIFVYPNHSKITNARQYEANYKMVWTSEKEPTPKGCDLWSRSTVVIL